MSKVQTAAPQVTITLSVAELEALIRRIVREEVALALDERDVYAEPTVIEPESPIHEDLVETLKMADAGTLRILTREEAFGD